MTKTIFAAAAAMALLCLSFPAGAAPAPASATQVERARFTVEVIGHGPDVILIPGLSTPRESWRAVADALKDHYRVHLVQIRGFGDAPGANAQGAVIDPFVSDLAAYARTLGHPAVIGHSLGGLSALKLGEAYPDLPSRIMAVDSVPFFTALFDPEATAQSAVPFAAMQRDRMLARKDQPRPAPRDCSAVSGDAPYRPGAMSVSAQGMCRIGNWMAAADPAAPAGAAYDAMTSDERGNVARIKAPLTVLYAVDTRGAKAEDVAAIYQQAYAKVPATKLVPIMNSAHFVMLDQPQQTIEAIRAFLR
ncbi:MAG: alpha/beta hydrolase [Proteobacteria bacterium]|nr:alpha/beta hydrolase [Pseudomonadota bacterium]